MLRSLRRVRRSSSNSSSGSTAFTRYKSTIGLRNPFLETESPLPPIADGGVTMAWVHALTDRLKENAVRVAKKDAAAAKQQPEIKEFPKSLDEIILLFQKSQTARKAARTFEAPIPKGLVLALLQLSLSQMRALPTLVDIHLPKEEGGGGLINICGDTHGQFFDLMHIFSPNVASWPSSRNAFLFNGDFVDRGLYSVEVIITLLALKLANTDAVHLLRGNHETTDMNAAYGFEEQVLAMYDEEVLSAFRQVFASMPVCAVVEEKVFVVHGGLGPTSFYLSLDELRALDRFGDGEEAKAQAAAEVAAAEAAAAKAKAAAAVVKAKAANDDAKADPNTDSEAEADTEGGSIPRAREFLPPAIAELLWSDPLQINPAASVEDQLGFRHNARRGGGWCFGPDVTAHFLAHNGLQLLLRSHEVRGAGFSIDHRVPFSLMAGGQGQGQGQGQGVGGQGLMSESQSESQGGEGGSVGKGLGGEREEEDVHVEREEGKEGERGEEGEEGEEEEEVAEGDADENTENWAHGGSPQGAAFFGCMTVFSAPNYCDDVGNLGALVRIGRGRGSGQGSGGSDRGDAGAGAGADGGDMAGGVVVGSDARAVSGVGASALLRWEGLLEPASRPRPLGFRVVQFRAVSHPRSTRRALKILGHQHEGFRMQQQMQEHNELQQQ